MSAGSALPGLIAMATLAWCAGFGLVAALRLNKSLRGVLDGVLTQMLSQGLVFASVSLFVIAPPALQWLIFLVGGARIIHEAWVLQTGQWSPRRIWAVLLSPLVPLSLFSSHVGRPEAAATLLMAYFLSEVFDSFSLLGGRMFGRRKIIPWLSPQKTWEGLASGSALTLLTALALKEGGFLSLNQALWAGPLAITFAFLGDCAASYGKRLASVKDYPVLINGQGGLLDILDSWLFVSTALVVLLKTMP